jgi:hypothetical protein
MQRSAVCYHAWRSEVHLGVSEEVGRVRYWACIFSAHVRENIMTRISILFVVSTTLAALALSVSSAGAAQVDQYHPPQAHYTTGASAKPPPDQPKGQKTIEIGPKPKSLTPRETGIKH